MQVPPPPRRDPEPGKIADPARVRECLAAVLDSMVFQRTDRSRALLQFVVEAALEGRGEDLKESILGVRVFDRPADYDVKTDPVVRVSMGRLRTKLERYYEREGAGAPVRILIPKGAYLPSFEELAPPKPVAAPPTPVAAPPARSRRRLAIGSAAVLAAVLSGALFALHPGYRPPSLDRLRPFVTSNAPNHPAFSPAGDVLAFDMDAPEDRHHNVYLQALDAASPERLSQDRANAYSATWSPDGSQIAFLEDLSPDSWNVFTVTLKDRRERKLGELRKGPSAWLNWSPDGQWLAGAEPDRKGSRQVVLLSVHGEERRSLTRPDAASRGDSLPVFSADSTWIAFRRTTPLSGHEDIFAAPQAGGPVKRLTFDDRGISGLAYLNDGSLLFSSKRTGPIRGLWWQPPGQTRPVRLTTATVDAGPPSVSRDGRHIALVVYAFDINIWSVAIDGSSAAAPLIASELPDSSPQISRDGSRLAFSSMRTGTDGIWVASRDGANITRLLDGAGNEIGYERWSPDGRRLVFEWHPANKAEIFVMSGDGGTPRSLVSDSYNNSAPAWSHDGAFVYFTSDRSGRAEIWRIPAAGGTLVQMTRQRAVAAQESAGGDALFFMQPAGADPSKLLRLPLRGGAPAGEPETVLSGLHPADWSNWEVGRDGVYYIHRTNSKAAVEYLNFATGAVRTIHQMERPPAFSGGMAISPDERTLLFTQVDREGSSIYVQ